MDIIKIILWVLQFGLGIGLIFLVLIHSGRGGGLSDMFGGGLGASAAGSTVMEKNLDRMTVVIALLFAFNTLVFALVFAMSICSLKRLKLASICDSMVTWSRPSPVGIR